MRPRASGVGRGGPEDTEDAGPLLEVRKLVEGPGQLVQGPVTQHQPVYFRGKVVELPGIFDCQIEDCYMDEGGPCDWQTLQALATVVAVRADEQVVGVPLDRQAVR